MASSSGELHYICKGGLHGRNSRTWGVIPQLALEEGPLLYQVITVSCMQL